MVGVLFSLMVYDDSLSRFLASNLWSNARDTSGLMMDGWMGGFKDTSLFGFEYTIHSKMSQAQVL